MTKTLNLASEMEYMFWRSKYIGFISENTEVKIVPLNFWLV